MCPGSKHETFLEHSWEMLVLVVRYWYYLCCCAWPADPTHVTGIIGAGATGTGSSGNTRAISPSRQLVQDDGRDHGGSHGLRVQHWKCWWHL